MHLDVTYAPRLTVKQYIDSYVTKEKSNRFWYRDWFRYYLNNMANPPVPHTTSKEARDIVHKYAARKSEDTGATNTISEIAELALQRAALLDYMQYMRIMGEYTVLAIKEDKKDEDLGVVSHYASTFAQYDLHAITDFYIEVDDMTDQIEAWTKHDRMSEQYGPYSTYCNVD